MAAMMAIMTGVLARTCLMVQQQLFPVVTKLLMRMKITMTMMMYIGVNW